MNQTCVCNPGFKLSDCSISEEEFDELQQMKQNILDELDASLDLLGEDVDREVSLGLLADVSAGAVYRWCLQSKCWTPTLVLIVCVCTLCSGSSCTCLETFLSEGVGNRLHHPRCCLTLGVHSATGMPRTCHPGGLPSSHRRCFGTRW